MSFFGKESTMIVYCNEPDFKSRRQVAREHPAATRVVRVTGGWAVMETEDDYRRWRNDGGAAERKGRGKDENHI